jgi:hypothetical protein
VQDNATRVGINFRTRGDIQMFVGKNADSGSNHFVIVSIQ